MTNSLKTASENVLKTIADNIELLGNTKSYEEVEIKRNLFKSIGDEQLLISNGNPTILGIIKFIESISDKDLISDAKTSIMITGLKGDALEFMFIDIANINIRDFVNICKYDYTNDNRYNIDLNTLSHEDLYLYFEEGVKFVKFFNDKILECKQTLNLPLAFAYESVKIAILNSGVSPKEGEEYWLNYDYTTLAKKGDNILTKMFNDNDRIDSIKDDLSKGGLNAEEIDTLLNKINNKEADTPLDKLKLIIDNIDDES